MSQQFLPINFKVPTKLETNTFHICPLTRNVADLDYEAVMSSQSELQGIFGRNSTWPNSNMTMNENLISIKVHEEEFEARKAFAYSVLNNAENKCFGSIYVDPSRSVYFDCEVHFWIRTDNLELEIPLYKVVSEWLQNEWPFTKVAYPGRQVSGERC
ncbi:hypothetical protein [Thalassotalea maritima]|uniref:hypothetical protein n=1 Tax=Thalassotalea maritima TaxID=3242416 RepID=UPI0035291768